MPPDRGLHIGTRRAAPADMTWSGLRGSTAVLAVVTLMSAAVVTLMPALRTVGADRRTDAPARVEIGYATYLAPAFHGDESASGERFDQRKLIAAHRTLPFGSHVRVTNLENGRSVEVRIVDRGPYGQNRREGTIIDVSRAAAGRLGMVKDGQVRVRVTVLRFGSAGSRPS
jgi:rare lipoprotein A